MLRFLFNPARFQRGDLCIGKILILLSLRLRYSCIHIINFAKRYISLAKCKFSRRWRETITYTYENY